MPRPMNHRHPPFWATEERMQTTTTPRAILNALRDLQTKSSTPGEALVFDGVTSSGQLAFRRVPHNYPRVRF
jgi:hypothetical protein